MATQSLIHIVRATARHDGVLIPQIYAIEISFTHGCVMICLNLEYVIFKHTASSTLQEAFWGYVLVRSCLLTYSFEKGAIQTLC